MGNRLVGADGITSARKALSPSFPYAIERESRSYELSPAGDFQLLNKSHWTSVQLCPEETIFFGVFIYFSTDYQPTPPLISNRLPRRSTSHQMDMWVKK